MPLSEETGHQPQYMTNIVITILQATLQVVVHQHLWASTFYVVTSDYNVYKVISNNNGAQSTVMPTGTSTNILTTTDGYKWKFMYSISASDVIKFVTSDFIPVKTIGRKEAVEGDVGGLGSACA